MKITCVVDDRISPGSACRAEHGASFWIEIEGRQVLFDTGQSGPVLLHNLAALGLEPGRLEALILSHGHYDHTGGLAALLDRRPGLPLYAHPDLFRPRYRKTDTGPRPIGPALDREAAARSAQLRLGTEPVEVVPGLWTSGEIADRSQPEGRSAYHIVREGRRWVADPYRDDLSVVIETADGPVLVCGCCHAGLLNTLAHVHARFGQAPVAVVGGTHLIHADGPTMQQVIDVLAGYGPPRLWLSHCTGERGFLALRAAFGPQVTLYQAGMTVSF